MLKNKAFLVTGGTGSFGKTIAHELEKLGAKEIRIFSRDEKKQEDMRIDLSNSKYKFYIGDVRDYQSLLSALEGVDYVFHAAALKQVPSCEFYPMEAVKTNVNGTENLIRASIEQKIKKVIVLSTDKAVYPINAMGISKAMAEKVAIAMSRMIDNSGTVVCCTRYGNVMGSRGSVIPLFAKQILNDDYVTITDPNMTRFLMTLDDSVDLVLHAFRNGQQGDIFVKKSPASSLEALVNALSEVLKKEPKRKIIGTRHGEKLYESLISREEMSKAQDAGDYFRIPADNRDLNYAKYFTQGEESISEFSDYTSHNTEQLDQLELIDLLSRLEIIKEKVSA
ncbi:MAG: polysaccharide biosynthesis protein [Gammaproteobacteria bacterium]|nr:polysaccharide biosynthesis protein [Gammaproteobacteria bacterium]